MEDVTRQDTSGLRVFGMGTGGDASVILQSLVERGENIVGVCCRGKTNPSPEARVIRILRQLVRKVLIALGLYARPIFVFKGPFEHLETPGDLASRLEIPVLDPRALRSQRFEDKLRRLECDVILVAGFRRLIPPDIIGIPKTAMVNFHTSLLPKHRGGTPTRWVIRQGDTETGVTAHYVSEEYDRGGMILQEKLSVLSDETYGELEVRLARLAARMAHRVLEMVAAGTVVEIPQDDQIATYEPSYKGSHQWINWELPACEIKRTCYAIRPLSGGMTTFDTKALCVWDVSVLDEVANGGLPGSIIEIDDCGLPVVACGTGTVKILEFLHYGNIVPANRLRSRFGMKRGAAFDRSLPSDVESSSRDAPEGRC